MAVPGEQGSEFRLERGDVDIGPLIRMADASLARPDDPVRTVVFPVVGEENLRNLVAEYKSSGSTYRRTVQTTYRASYTNHYRSGLIRLLQVLEFRSEDSHQPVLDGVKLVGRHRCDGVDPPGRWRCWRRWGSSRMTRWPRRFLGVAAAAGIVTYHHDPREDPGQLAHPAAVVAGGSRLQ